MVKNEVLYDEVFDAQQDFRVLLEAMARPGKICRLEGAAVDPPAGLHRTTSLAAFALLNGDTRFYVCNDVDGQMGTYLRENTGAEMTTMEKADYVFCSGDYDMNCISQFKRGTLQEPEDSATVFIDLEDIAESGGVGDVRIVLQGPGVETEKVLFLRKVQASLFWSVSEINDEFPIGIDLFLTDAGGRVIAIPRSCHVIAEQV
jgi:alpha-D-ribose 1-methylphosphonate 5-triphosphate synthase subunit PhnH